jgi:carbamoyltransferase
MAILGLYDGHNSCAAVISEESGKIVAAVEEERFSRIKNHDSRQDGVPGPVNSVAYCLAQSTEPIRHVALALAAPHDLARLSVNAFLDSVRDGETGRLDTALTSGLDHYDLMRLPYRTQARRLQTCLDTLAQAGVDPDSVRIHHVRHHVAHAASAFLPAPLESALVVTLDGMGDGLSGMIFHGEGRALRGLLPIDAAQSLGHLYSAFTVACGFESLRHEGKITALAASGMVNEDLYRQLGELYRFDTTTGQLRGGLSTGLPLGPYPHRIAGAHIDRVRVLITGMDIKDAAATVQQFTEDVVCALIDHYQRQTGADTVALAGGLFANVTMNYRIATLPAVRRVVVHPAMSDAGLAVGAASHVYAERHERRPIPMTDAFLGPSYRESEVVGHFREAGFHVLNAPPDGFAARALAEGKVVARFVGRAEYGPRALGNRSILAPAGDPHLPGVLNDMLRRSHLMPFAPVTLVEEAPERYAGIDSVDWSAHYMTVALPCLPAMVRESPAAVHRDGTARPQLVGDENPNLQRLMREYQRITSLPTLINTSLNIHDEPMVLSPADALKSVVAAGIDIVQVDDRICVASLDGIDSATEPRV